MNKPAREGVQEKGAEWDRASREMFDEGDGLVVQDFDEEYKGFTQRSTPRIRQRPVPQEIYCRGYLYGGCSDGGPSCFKGSWFYCQCTRNNRKLEERGVK